MRGVDTGYRFEVSGRSPDDLERALATAERRLVEMQAWVDSSDEEAATLRARVAELEAKATGGSQAAELQQWLDAAEAEGETLRARVVDLEAKASGGGQAAELQQWLDAAEAENESLREKLAGEEKVAYRDEKQVNELKAWLSAAEAENEKLSAQLAEANPEVAKELKERVAELESTVASLREVNRRFSEEAARSGQREVARLQAELERARADGSNEKTVELSALLENAREAISTLEAERRNALTQVQRYAARDSQLSAEHQRKSHALQQEQDARLAVLQASLGQREGEIKKLEARVIAYATSETTLKEELERLRVRECEAREQLAHVRTERDTLESQKSEFEEQVRKVSSKLDETKRWLESAEAESEGLEKKLEAERLEVAMREAEREAQAVKASSAPPPSRGISGSAGPPEADDDEGGVEGFSVARLRRLESMLTAETLRADTLRRFLAVADKSLSSVKDQLELAQARLLDMAKKLGIQDSGDSAETAQRLADAAREVVALEKEIAEALRLELPPPPPLDAFEEAPREAPKEEDVLSAPMDAVEALTDAQASATRKATEALEGEQRAKDQLVTDLSWLKTQLAQLSQVRDELKVRLEAMVQRELKRKAVVASLVEQLRTNEAGAAARAGALRRLQAAIGLAQRNAVRVQTIYFQKQIGSLQRQLEIALGKKRAPLGQGPKLGALRAPPTGSAPRDPDRSRPREEPAGPLIHPLLGMSILIRGWPRIAAIGLPKRAALLSPVEGATGW